MTIARWHRAGQGEHEVGEVVGDGAQLGSGGARCALLFGDVRGVSKLRKDQLPPFLGEVLGRFAKVLDAFGDGILLRNT